jgi:hypothetical protein
VYDIYTSLLEFFACNISFSRTDAMSYSFHCVLHAGLSDSWDCGVNGLTITAYYFSSSCLIIHRGIDYGELLRTGVIVIISSSAQLTKKFVPLRTKYFYFLDYIITENRNNRSNPPPLPGSPNFNSHSEFLISFTDSMLYNSDCSGLRFLLKIPRYIRSTPTCGFSSFQNNS